MLRRTSGLSTSARFSIATPSCPSSTAASESGDSEGSCPSPSSLVAGVPTSFTGSWEEGSGVTGTPPASSVVVDSSLSTSPLTGERAAPAPLKGVRGALISLAVASSSDAPSKGAGRGRQATALRPSQSMSQRASEAEGGKRSTRSKRALAAMRLSVSISWQMLSVSRDSVSCSNVSALEGKAAKRSMHTAKTCRAVEVMNEEPSPNRISGECAGHEELTCACCDPSVHADSMTGKMTPLKMSRHVSSLNPPPYATSVVPSASSAALRTCTRESPTMWLKPYSSGHQSCHWLSSIAMERPWSVGRSPSFRLGSSLAMLAATFPLPKWSAHLRTSLRASKLVEASLQGLCAKARRQFTSSVKSNTSRSRWSEARRRTHANARAERAGFRSTAPSESTANSVFHPERICRSRAWAIESTDTTMSSRMSGSLLPRMMASKGRRNKR
mmetsp:Transcript_39414/g.79594  ORF Transcript_39414/g.79594 Transcript_39414/m.79594 type:complete len:443 (-) Transcript_39414:273-1601(-)